MDRGLRACFVALIVLLSVWVGNDVNPFRSVSPGVVVGPPAGIAGQPTLDGGRAASGSESGLSAGPGAGVASRLDRFDQALAESRVRAVVGRLCLAPFLADPVVSFSTAQGAVSDAEFDSWTADQRAVAVAYCALLRRLPDTGGLGHWLGRLAEGMTSVEMVEQIVASAEYRARPVQPFRATLANLTLAPDRRAESEARAQAAAETEALRAAQALEAAQRAVEEAKRSARLRVRNEIAAADFQAWVRARPLGDSDPITPALIHRRRVGDGQRINVAYVHLSATRGVAVSPGDRGRSTVGTYGSEIGAHVAINGNWYGPYDGPAVSGGVVYGGDDHDYTALFGFTADGDAIIDHHREINPTVDDRVVEGVSGHPTLVFRGETTTDFGNDPTFTARNPRTAIGLDRTGDVLIMVTVDGRSSTARGMTGSETAVLLAELGAHDAVMLDGGGSTTMWIADRGIVNRPSGAPRAVANQIVAFGN